MMFRRVLKLDHLRDVVVQSPQNNQVLKYNGIYWVNDFVSGGGGGTGDIVKIAEWEMDSDVIIASTEETTIVEIPVNFDFNIYKYFTVDCVVLKDSSVNDSGLPIFLYKEIGNANTFSLILDLKDTYRGYLNWGLEYDWYIYTAGLFDIIIVKRDVDLYRASFGAFTRYGDNYSDIVVSGISVDTGIAVVNIDVDGVPDRFKLLGYWWYQVDTEMYCKFYKSIFRIYGYK